ncbi:LysR family transcriptional regulator [Ensifer sp. ENS10]|uniref:LysR family transcriptional regulator n=1 Tax=unclassified Ensifer TaxID=2633371 RepID=UPI0007095943|nr:MULTISPECIES: LysR family transcriptional regulator [unclassified Ensifer]KRD63750.1 LysR family transcriptional regulator [Ensifer sp. Root278]MBD9508744.1 LysR family transcriptional regulator [Ensifer sp. ENS10]MBV7517747.1 LysR family transcriptional regulator [Ensifer sp. ENS12]
MDRLDAMGVLLAVIDSGSLSAASRQLKMPLATVSRKVSELEAHLGAQLITRTNRKILLTETGRSYVEAAKEILARVEEAERVAAGEYSAVKGDLTISAPIVFGRLHVLPVVVDFLKAHPEIDMRLALGDRFANLVDDHIDLALRIGNLPDSNLVATRLGSVRRVVYASPGYVAQHGAPGHPNELAEHDCITFENVTAAHVWRFLDDGRELAAPIRSRLIVNTAESAVDAAISGLGLTRVLSYQVARPVSEGLLVPLLEAFEHPPLPVQLVYLPQGLVPMKLRAFVDFAVPRLRGVLR